MRVAILAPGEMGAAVGSALVATGHDLVWLPTGRSAVTADRAKAAGIRGVDDLRGCELVISVVPPSAAVANAEALGGFSGLYIDANATSPETAGRVAAAVRERGARYVDGSIIGPPPTASGTTRLYLGGDDAPEAARTFEGSRLQARVLSGAGPTAASALKMAYGSWTKGSAALLLAARSTAEQWKVGDALEAEWAISQQELAGQLAAARKSATAKGWRWVDEMDENARTFDAVGEPSGFGSAAAEVFRRYPKPDG